MTPILAGIVASGISGHLTPPFTPSSSYDALATYTVGSGGISSVTFAGLPTGGQYTHLQLRALSWTDDTQAGGLGNVRVYCYFNNDTNNSNYYSHYLYGTGGATVTSDPDNNAKFGPNTCRNSYIAPAVSVLDILDYSNINKYKTARALSGLDNNDTNGLIRMTSGLWMSKSAINSITLVPESGSYKQYSQFSLYGVKG